MKYIPFMFHPSALSFLARADCINPSHACCVVKRGGLRLTDRGHQFCASLDVLERLILDQSRSIYDPYLAVDYEH